MEYDRHDPLSLGAALNTKTGQVAGQTTPRHTSAGFVRWLTTLVASRPCGHTLHVMLDIQPTPRTKQGPAVRALHPQVTLHVTPTCSSWLNQVELWFSRLERDVLARGICTSVKERARTIRRDIARCHPEAQPFRWSYSDATRRIA